MFSLYFELHIKSKGSKKAAVHLHWPVSWICCGYHYTNKSNRWLTPIAHREITHLWHWFKPQINHTWSQYLPIIHWFPLSPPLCEGVLNFYNRVLQQRLSYRKEKKHRFCWFTGGKCLNCSIFRLMWHTDWLESQVLLKLFSLVIHTHKLSLTHTHTHTFFWAIMSQ